MTFHFRDAATEDIDFLAAMLLEAVNWRQDQPPATLQSIMENPLSGITSPIGNEGQTSASWHTRQTAIRSARPGRGA